MRRSILLLFSFGVIVAGASAGDLHTDIFGNVCDGDCSIPVGQVEPGSLFEIEDADQALKLRK